MHVYESVRFRSRVPDNNHCTPLEAPQQPTMHQACQSKPELAFWLKKKSIELVQKRQQRKPLIDTKFRK